MVMVTVTLCVLYRVALLSDTELIVIGSFAVLMMTNPLSHQLLSVGPLIRKVYLVPLAVVKFRLPGVPVPVVLPLRAWPAVVLTVASEELVPLPY